jgi:hypothetical protein
VFIAFARFQHNAGGIVDAEPANSLEPKVYPVNQSVSQISSSLRDTVSEDQNLRYSLPSFGNDGKPIGMTDQFDYKYNGTSSQLVGT